jgi:hypothetical protein
MRADSFIVVDGRWAFCYTCGGCKRVRRYYEAASKLWRSSVQVVCGQCIITSYLLDARIGKALELEVSVARCEATLHTHHDR